MIKLVLKFLIKTESLKLNPNYVLYLQDTQTILILVFHIRYCANHPKATSGKKKKLIMFGEDWKRTEGQYFSTAGHMEGIPLQEESIG